jgi:hypothetical protein
MTIRPTCFLVLLATIFTCASCQKEYTDEGSNGSGNSSGTAAFTVAGAPGACTNPVIAGSYQAGTILDNTNTLAIAVTVGTAGTYAISTNTSNGIVFSASGTFVATGLQNITLKAAGNPVTAGTFSFSVGTNGCSFSLTCTGAASNDNCKECIYLPFCAGSTYLYADSSFNPLTGEAIVVDRRSDMVSSTDTSISGKPYHKIGVFNGTSNNFSYVNCSNGETSVIAYNIESTTSGNVVLAIKSTELKASAAVGSSWSDTSIFATGNRLYREHTIIAKGISRSVLGTKYTDVIQVRVVQNLFYVDPPLGLQPAGVTDYYLAGGTGLIETITTAENPLTGEAYIGYHSVLKAVHIP